MKLRPGKLPARLLKWASRRGQFDIPAAWGALLLATPSVRYSAVKVALRRLVVAGHLRRRERGWYSVPGKHVPAKMVR